MIFESSAKGLLRLEPLRSPAVMLLPFLVLLHGYDAKASQDPDTPNTTTVEQIEAFFTSEGKTVLTFVGYSGAGYEDLPAMLNQAAQVLDHFDAATTIVNIGATPDGIGAIYEMAQQRGFATTGIVSTQARDYEAEISPYAENVFFVEDASWGGLMEGTDRLSPTSSAMVRISDIVIGIGGGAVARDEMLAAQKLGKDVRFIPAEMNHQIAIQRALKKSLPEPTDFHGAAHQAFASLSDQ